MRTIVRGSIFPDFIIAARDADGSDVMWIAETKERCDQHNAEEPRRATLVRQDEAARISGQWRYLFMQQRKLEVVLAAGVSSLTELAER